MQIDHSIINLRTIEEFWHNMQQTLLEKALEFSSNRATKSVNSGLIVMHDDSVSSLG